MDCKQDLKEYNRHKVRLLKLLAKSPLKGHKYKQHQDKYLLIVKERSFTFNKTLMDDLAAKGCIEIVEDVACITRLGIDKLQWLLNPDFQGKLETTSQYIDVNNLKQNVTVNVAESPLLRLYHRKGKTGLSFISHNEFQAGEQLRRDFEQGQLQPKISASLSSTVGGGQRFDPADISDFAIDARKSLHKALDSLGPELSSVTVDVCCFLKGLELVERERKWPPRSAKLMLKTALSMLARHYGIVSDNKSATRQNNFWGTQDYRPKIA